MPTPECLDDYYGTYYEGKGAGIAFPDPERFARHLLRTMEWRNFGRPARILDFGGGDGTLALAIARRIVAADPSREVSIALVDYQPPAIREEPGVRMTHALPTEPFEGGMDLVVASAILEHVPELHRLIERLFAAIGRGGYFYARTPEVVPFTKIIRSLDLTYPAHVHDLGSGFWNRAVDLFAFDGRYVASRPSLVESLFREQPLRTLAAYTLKAPSHLEGRLSPAGRKDRFWNLVGGWEVVLRRNGKG
jgi:SAM-dependent methyltransferase